MNLFDDLPEPTNSSTSFKPVNTALLKRKLEVDVNSCTNKKKHCNYISFKSFVSARKGEREDMQDAHILIDNFTEYMKKNFKLDVVSDDVYDGIQNGFYGVYDGHNGCKASTFAAENLHRYLANIFPKGDCQSLEVDIKRIFTDVYKKIDEEFLKIASKQRPHLRDGSTAVNVLIINRTMYIANIGDSKAVLARQSKESNLTAISLTKDHTAIDYEERLRLQKHGSVVRDGRLNGTLEISRSFGDYQYKKQGVTCVPDVKKCRITDSDKFLIIACDGLWKTFSPQEAVEFVDKIVSIESSDSLAKRFETACNKLCNEAVLKMSGDNVTVMIVVFNI